MAASTATIGWMSRWLVGSGLFDFVFCGLLCDKRDTCSLYICPVRFYMIPIRMLVNFIHRGDNLVKWLGQVFLPLRSVLLHMTTHQLMPNVD